MTTGTQYVAAAYGVILLALLLYVAVVALRAGRLAREAELLARMTADRMPAATGGDGSDPAAEGARR